MLRKDILVKRDGFTLTNFVVAIVVALTLACLVASCTKHPEDISPVTNTVAENVNTVENRAAPENTQAAVNPTVNESLPSPEVMERLNAVVGAETPQQPVAVNKLDIAAGSESALPAEMTGFISPCAQLMSKESKPADSGLGEKDKSNGPAGALDGKNFSGKIGKMGTIKADKDKFIFENGQFHSSICQSYGVVGSVYQTTSSVGDINFNVETSSAGGSVQWKGVVKGNRLEGTATVVQAGKPEEQYWFLGKLN